MNVYRYRGAMHYNYETFQNQIRYFEILLGLPASEMGRKDGTTQITGLSDVVDRLGNAGLAKLTSPGGELFNLIFSRNPLTLDWPIAYSNQNFIAYRRINGN
jgi:hypothetical protein